jgi:D-alanyl-D-alanine carboxypeptidase
MVIRSTLVAFALFAAPAAFAQSLNADERTQVDLVVNDALKISGTPSASIAIVRGGEIVFAKAYGKQAETMPVPRDDAPYQIASISKQFTAAAILLLAREGKLALDDKVAKYVPDITDGDRITVRQLLSHTAGLQDYWPQDYSFKAMATPVTPREIVDRWARKPLDFAPGTQWQYSNTGYVVAGMIVEKVAGMPLLDFLKARIFKPLDIAAFDQDLAIGKGFPQGYGRAAMGPVRVVTPAANGWLFAAGELAMSARDLAKWDVARLDRTILTPEDWMLQETPVKLADGSTNGYGLGVSTGIDNGRRFVEHSGEAVGFLSENIVFPDERAAIVVLTNSWSGDAYLAIRKGLAKTILPAPVAAPASNADTAALARVRLVYDQLRTGKLDRALLTENANYYFTPVTLDDYRKSLSPLGEPLTIDQTGSARLRGGFVNRNFRLTYGDKVLAISTYAEPGENGRLEQFLVAPTNR